MAYFQAPLLDGLGDDDIQILRFVNNTKIRAKESNWTASISVFSVTRGTTEHLDDQSQKTIQLRRKRVGDAYAFKAEEGRFWMPKAVSLCEQLRVDWALFDSTLNYEFIGDAEDE